jgi:type III restriction enzyme
MTQVQINQDVLAVISHQMDLRTPNREAITDIATAISDHFDVRESEDVYEGLIVSATGVGKTYVIGGTIDYLAQTRGWSNFLVIVPGRTIREKTIQNFTPGSARDISTLLGVETAVVTAENYDTPDVARVMEDPSIVKVYVMTVQGLLPPTNSAPRKTRKFSEGLGAEFYDWLRKADDLVVLADEHHLYYGPRFSETVRGLEAKALIGLTATPSPKTPTDQIVFRYPLVAAIADQFVKTPVIVGRKDDRSDLLTRLNDGVTLLESKRTAMDAYVSQSIGRKAVNAFMLVVARDTAEAEEIAGILRSDEFREGSYRDNILQVDSSVNEDQEPGMWARLENVDAPDSAVRVIVSVAMLKEGWDVKGAYVLMSTQPSLSTILTEQVLGRGLRLPFGAYTGIELLDTLEVIAHDRFQELLKKAGVLSEQFVSYRTRTQVSTDQNGDNVVQTVTEEISTGGPLPPVVSASSVAPLDDQENIYGDSDEEDFLVSPGLVALTATEDRQDELRAETALVLRPPVVLRETAPSVILPKLRQRPSPYRFSLGDITDDDGFRALGRRLRTNPETELRRMAVTAINVIGPDGIVRSETRQVNAKDIITSPSVLDVDLDWSKLELIQFVLQLPIVDSSNAMRRAERKHAKRLVNAMVEGLGDKAETLLSAYLGRAKVRLGDLITAEQRKLKPTLSFDTEVDFEAFNPIRTLGVRTISTDRYAGFSKDVAYEGWAKSLLALDWFDSSTERLLAQVLDLSPAVVWWARLQRGDLTIAWGSNQLYNPDFLVAEPDGRRYLVEVKGDSSMTDAAVLAKKDAAKTWINHVNALDEVEERSELWTYLLVSEQDLKLSKESWESIKQFG